MARDDLKDIYDRQEPMIGPEAAMELVEAIEDACEGLSTFSNRGTPRNELAQGLRSIPFGKKQAVIGYLVTAREVEIVGIMWRGRDVSALAHPGRLP
jgi:toxin ParE1/3/4